MTKQQEHHAAKMRLRSAEAQLAALQARYRLKRATLDDFRRFWRQVGLDHEAVKSWPRRTTKLSKAKEPLPMSPQKRLSVEG